MEDMKKILETYKKGSYKRKNYTSGEDLRADCASKRVFWFKRKFSDIPFFVIELLIVYIVVLVGVFVYSDLEKVEPSLPVILVTPVILLIYLILIFAFRIPNFILIGPNGILWKEYFKINFLAIEKADNFNANLNNFSPKDSFMVNTKVTIELIIELYNQMASGEFINESATVKVAKDFWDNKNRIGIINYIFTLIFVSIIFTGIACLYHTTFILGPMFLFNTITLVCVLCALGPMFFTLISLQMLRNDEMKWEESYILTVTLFMIFLIAVIYAIISIMIVGSPSGNFLFDILILSSGFIWLIIVVLVIIALILIILDFVWD